MYFYIFENVKSSKEKKLQEKIKKLVIELGISGEVVSPNPARTIDELVDIGLTKGFSTFIGIGNDLFANKIISSLLVSQKKFDEKIVFGYVALDPTKSLIAKMINTQTIDLACKALRYRTLKSFSPGLVAPNKFFITPLSITSQYSFSAHLIFSDMEVITSATDIKISSDMYVGIEDKTLKKNKIVSLFNKIINKESIDINTSQFRTNALKLVCEPSLPVKLHEEIIAKTPIQIKRFDKYLQMIVNRDSIGASNDKE